MNKINFADKYLFYRSIEILITLNRKMNLSRLAREANMTYSHTSKTIKELKDAGLVDTLKEGRQILLTLTPTGEELRQLIFKIKEELKDAEWKEYS